MPITTPSFRSQLLELMSQVFQRAFDDWKAMFGFEANVERVGMRVLRSTEELLEVIVGEGCIVRTILQGRATGPLLYAFPIDFLGQAVASALMIPNPADLEGNWEEEEQQDALHELMNLFCGSSTHAIEELEYRLRVSQSLDHLKVEISPENLAGDLPLDVSLCCFDVTVSTSLGEAKMWLLMPEDVALAFETK